MNELSSKQATASRSTNRLEPIRNDRSLYPFVRAEAVTDCSVYWMPVGSFPVRKLQRDWLLEFLDRLGAEQKAAGLREEWFLLFKTLYPNLLQTFIDRSSRYVPITGVTLLPGTVPTPLPTFDEVKTSVERSTKSGTPVDVNQWMPDQAHWFAMKEPEAQRQDFLGHGGMFALYLAPGAAAAAFPKLPRFMTTSPAYTPEMQKQYEMLSAMQDGFLKRSKELFGEPYREDPAFKGLMFVLPLLTARTVVGAELSERQRWLELADLYFFESPADNGMLLISKNPEFDPVLMDLLDHMRDDDKVYPQ